MGAKREEVMQPAEKRKTAYHEAGHTLAALFLPGAQRVHKVTVIPRGMSLGSTQILPSEDRMNMSESEIKDNLVVLLAGRAAEKIIYDQTSVGAENDLERATSLARENDRPLGHEPEAGPCILQAVRQRSVSRARDSSATSVQRADAGKRSMRKSAIPCERLTGEQPRFYTKDARS